MIFRFAVDVTTLPPLSICTSPQIVACFHFETTGSCQLFSAYGWMLKLQRKLALNPITCHNVCTSPCGHQGTVQAPSGWMGTSFPDCADPSAHTTLNWVITKRYFLPKYEQKGYFLWCKAPQMTFRLCQNPINKVLGIHVHRAESRHCHNETQVTFHIIQRWILLHSQFKRVVRHLQHRSHTVSYLYHIQTLI